MGFAYLPALLVAQGIATPDTKDYLYIDPGHFLSQVLYLWYPSQALGTVTHQYIGYLWPMGPFFWVAKHIGLPLWVSERLWEGTFLCAAGLGFLYLMKTFRVGGPGPLVGALGYMLSPYFLQYVSRMSVILLPWAGLPFMLAFAIRACRDGHEWRYAAAFALVAATVGGINATSLLYVGILPVVWIFYSWLGRHEISAKRAWTIIAKFGSLTLLTALWWIAGLWVEGAYGIDVLKYTETVFAVSSTELASEIMRGLGYWYFYGSDRLGPWMTAMVSFTTWLWVLALTFLIPALAVAAGGFLKWRHRTFFIWMMFFGVVIAVGTHPYGNSSPWGTLMRIFMNHTEAGMALRGTDRATPMVLISLMVLLACGITALVARARLLGITSAVLVGALVLAANPAVFDGQTIPATFTRANHLPRYYHLAADYLNTHDLGTRVLGIPGDNFASETWGDAVDPVLPGLLRDRPYVKRQQQIYGSLATADLLYALDSPIQQDANTWNTSELVPLARLMSVGDIALLSNDIYARYNTPPPRPLWAMLKNPPKGLGKPIGFGKPRPNISLVPEVDEWALSRPGGQSWPAPIEIFPVSDPRAILRAESPENELVLDGGAVGLRYAAEEGLLSGNPAILYSASYARDPAELRKLTGQDAQLVVTSSHRKRGYIWSTLQANVGYTESTHHKPTLHDPANVPLEVFKDAPKDTYTMVRQEGVYRVWASSYGNPVTFIPEDRAAMAFKGDPNQAWLTSAFSDPIGQWIAVEFKHPKTVSSLNLVQPLTGDPNRWITKVEVQLGHKKVHISAKLGPQSRTPKGQTIYFKPEKVRLVRIFITGIAHSRSTPTKGLSPVGFSEIHIDHTRVHELTILPSDLLRNMGASSLSHRLAFILARERVGPYPPRESPERRINDLIWLPTSRTFSLSGTARMSALIPDQMIDKLLGQPGASEGGVTASSSGRLPGDLNARAGDALNPTGNTFWGPGFDYPAQIGAWVQYEFPKAISLDHLNMRLIADERHSEPTVITISAGGKSDVVEVPPVSQSPVPDATVEVPLHFPRLTGRTVRITIDAIHAYHTVNYYSDEPITLPIAIANVGIPGAHMPPIPKELPSTCTTRILSVNGKPVPVRIIGSTKAAADLQALQLQPCGWAKKGITLHKGYNVISTERGRVTGWNVNKVVLDSAPGGGPEPPLPNGSLPPTPSAKVPKVKVVSFGKTSAKLRITSATSPFWLVLGESINKGWTAKLDGISLGPPSLIDGFANGWYVSKADLKAIAKRSGSKGAKEKDPPNALTAVITWTPQGVVWAALIASALGMLLCLAIVAWPRRRKARASHVGRNGKALASSGEQIRVGRSCGPELPELWIPEGSTYLRAIEMPSWLKRLVPPSGVGAQHDTVAVGWRVVLMVSLIVGGLVAVFVQPFTGLALAACTAVALSVPRARKWLAIGAVGSMLSCGAYVVILQAVKHYPASSVWPSEFPWANSLAWLAVSLLAVDAALEMTFRHLARRRLASERQAVEPEP